MKFNDMVPYIYGITANINFILSQIFFKMLTVVIPPSVVLSFQAFFHLIFNTFIIVSNKNIVPLMKDTIIFIPSLSITNFKEFLSKTNKE